MNEKHLKELKEIRSVIWGKDIARPACPEYVEWHENVTKILSLVDALINKIEGEMRC